jgi:hypothetical protein
MIHLVDVALFLLAVFLCLAAAGIVIIVPVSIVGGWIADTIRFRRRVCQFCGETHHIAARFPGGVCCPRCLMIFERRNLPSRDTARDYTARARVAAWRAD